MSSVWNAFLCKPNCSKIGDAQLHASNKQVPVYIDGHCLDFNLQNTLLLLKHNTKEHAVTAGDIIYTIRIFRTAILTSSSERK